MPLDLNTALNSYGFVGTLANAIPDLKGILNQAIANEWAPAQFARAVEDSGWFKSNAESIRKLATMQALDPATYAQNLANATGKVQLMGYEMGVTNPSSGIAYQALLYNWDDQQIREQIASQGSIAVRPEGGVTGNAAQLQGHMSQLFTDYGVAFTQATMNDWSRHILAGHDTLDGFEAMVKARSKAQYAHLAGQIDAGMTIRDIADPYIASYAQTLEVPETSVTLSDRAIQAALQVKDPASGAFSTQPMHEFVRKLKDDPRWDQTKNAEDEAYRFVSRLGKDMGFVS